MKHSRKDYLARKVTHEEYYAQFVTSGVKNTVSSAIGKKNILASTDEYFNDIPLRQWDDLYTLIGQQVGNLITEATNYGGYSLSDTVCVAKEAARQIVEENKVNS